MCTADAMRDGGDAFHPAVGCGFGGASRALEMASAALDYLNSAAVADLDGAARGETLIALGEIQAKLTAAHAAFLRRFDAANAHDADGYGSSSSWLAAKAGMSKKGARAVACPLHTPPGNDMRTRYSAPTRRWVSSAHGIGMAAGARLYLLPKDAI